MTGAARHRERRRIVSGETWLRSTSMPSRFISRTTSSPNGGEAVMRPGRRWRRRPRRIEYVGQRHVARAEVVHLTQHRQRIVDLMAAFDADH